MAGRLSVKKGDRFGRWLVLERVPSVAASRSARFLCACDCGTHRELNASVLVSKRSTSCGCYAKEIQPFMNRHHGMRNSPTYVSWKGMLQRCNNQNDPSYARYGGRGVTVCERWSSFENFWADMGTRPTGETIDRINPHGNYDPENCKWSTPREQQNNRRINHMIDVDGSKKTVTQVCRERGLNFNTVLSRLRRGMPVELALSKASLKA